MITEQVIKAVESYRQSAKQIASKVFVGKRYSASELNQVKRTLKKLAESGFVDVKKVKVSHPVNIQGKFGGAAMGVHYELHYKIAATPAYIAPGISVQSVTVNVAEREASLKANALKRKSQND